MLAVPMCSADLTWKEPVQGRDVPLGEPVGEGGARAIDWGSPRLQAEFWPLEDELTDWSSHSSVEEEEWDWG